MWEDPIVAEVHRTREKLAAECNFDVKAILRGSSQASGVRSVAGWCPKKNEPNQRLKSDRGRNFGSPVQRLSSRPRHLESQRCANLDWHIQSLSRCNGFGRGCSERAAIPSTSWFPLFVFPLFAAPADAREP